MKKLLISFLTLMSLSLSAQDFKVVKDNCMPVSEESYSSSTGEDGSFVVNKVMRRLPAINTQWDSTKVYRQLVLLVEFEGDTTYFNMPTPKETYNRIFNEPGYNGGTGVGCVADYYRAQSGGLMNLQFDVYGPYQVSVKSQPYDAPTANTRNYGREALIEATRIFIEENTDVDFSMYDWNRDGKVNQVIYVYAGYAGNVASSVAYGHIWPNTSTFTTLTTHDGKKISDYTCSGEMWPTKTYRSCGIGTICHEFTHSLGLPDIYPTSNNAGYSMLDEWDLMDGGNFTGYGWCPPNFTPFEKMLLGWLTPVDLTEPTSVKDLKPSSEGGEVYRIKHTDNEFLLLENRQQRGWDLGAPGKGLLVYHVFYDASTWSANRVNNNVNKRGYDLVHADNMDFDDWSGYVVSLGAQYKNPNRMNSYMLSQSPYPYFVDSLSICNDSLTDNSFPSTAMITENKETGLMLSKPITNIDMTDDGLISFDFMGGSPVSAINEIVGTESKHQTMSVYDLNGRQSLMTSNRHGLYLVRRPDGTVRKVIK